MVSSLDQRVERVREYMKTPEFAKLWRYASVSVISTVLSLTLLYLFFNVAKIPSAAWCNFAATSITSVPAYYLNRTWAWGKSGKSHIMREVVPFWVISIVSIVLSTGAVKLGSHEAHHLTHSHAVITLVIMASNFATYAVLWVVKFIIFNRLLFKSHHDADDSDLNEPGNSFSAPSHIKTIQAPAG